MKITNTVLTLFFTRGESLKTWIDLGNFDREIELYKKLSNNLKRVNFATYGGNQDRVYANKLGKIKLLSVKWDERRTFAIFSLLIKYFPQLLKTDVLKTNQISGSEIPLWFKKYFGKKLIVRCGYLHSQFTKKQTKNKKAIKHAVELERKAFSLADMGIVTSLRDRNYLIREYGINPAKIKVIPNYVVTDIFKPLPKIKKKYDLVFVGRADKQKNLTNLLKAIHYLKTKKKNLSLLMIGACCSDKKVRKLINRYVLNVTFKGNVPNFDLPKPLNQAKVFILPSYYEGHSKALLEAMSCGLPCIATNVIGIKEDIGHLKTGLLCNTDYKSIANAIEKALSDSDLRKKLGKNARNYVMENYAIDKVIRLELNTIREVGK